jgi:acyl-CoA reductase-like NAD-dependent aldehyde dehydrogenase
MSKTIKQWIGGKWIESKESHQVNNPYDGKSLDEYGIASPEEIESTLQAAAQAKKPFEKSSRFIRARLLAAMQHKIQARKQEFIDIIISEAGKPHTLADGEVTRCLATFQTASEEATKFVGETYAMDVDAGGRAFATARTEFFPKGIILAITPFNFPLNLVAHKVAPALAVGAPIILKPAPQAPGAAFLLAKIFEEACLDVNDEFGKQDDLIPSSALQVLFASNENAILLSKDSRISIISFTGSPSVGWKLQEIGNKKKVLLELGGNAGVILASDADLNLAAARSAFGATAYAGQSCISVQRIFAVADIYDEFKEKLISEFTKIKSGDPKDKSVMVGPLIDAKAKERILSWIDEAKNAGAKVLVGGDFTGGVLNASLLENVPSDCKLSQEEAFGPVAILEKVANLQSAIDKVNDSKYGLHAGVFTNHIGNIQRCFDELEVGGVIINEVPTFRADHMPYGGIKESGIGREGVRYAMEDFCERKTLVIKKSNL